MAIINSVVMGSAKNKVGEVVITTKNGRSVARKYQGSVEDRKSPAQLAQRAKLANMTLVSQAFLGVISNAFLAKGKYQSTVNAFQSVNLMSMPDTVQPNAADALTNATGDVLIAKGRLGLTPITATGSSVAIDINPVSNQLAVGDVAVAVALDASTGVATRQELAITAMHIASGSVTVPIVSNPGDFVGGWVYTKKSRKGSTGIVTAV